MATRIRQEKVNRLLHETSPARRNGTYYSNSKEGASAEGCNKNLITGNFYGIVTGEKNRKLQAHSCLLYTQATHIRLLQWIRLATPYIGHPPLAGEKFPQFPYW